MRCAFAFVFSVALLIAPQLSAASPAYGALQSVAKEMTFSWARRHPMTATQLGISGYDGDFDNPSEGARTKDIAQIESWLRQLRKISAAGGSTMTLVERDDAKLLQAQLTSMSREYTVYKTDRKDYAGPANAVVSVIFTQFEHLPTAAQSDGAAIVKTKSWADIIARLEKAPRYIVAAQRLVRTPGHLYGVVGSKELAGVPDFFNGALTDAAKANLSGDRFMRFAAARDNTLAVIRATKKYIDTHVAAWPENYAIGRKAYDAMLRDEELLSFDARDIERMAYDELAHGWAVRMWLEHLSKRSGMPFGPASGGGMAPGGKALIGYYSDRIAELRNYVTADRIVSVPSWLGQIQVVETPKFLQPVSPGAGMNSPRLFAQESIGSYYITPPTSLTDAAKRLDPNEDFDRDRIWSTAAHEAMPGHFLQLSIARRHPDFVRKIQGSSVFAEGWAYYGEEMFVQLGMYGEDLDGRLYTAQWERVRGARAVVDPELAIGNWTYRQAADFFARQTGFPKDEADAAVAGIALGPGSVIAYTAGRNQLEILEAQYRQKMGAKGSLLDFHDRLLCYGTTPFAVVGPELLADLKKPLEQVRAAANY